MLEWVKCKLVVFLRFVPPPSKKPDLWVLKRTSLEPPPFREHIPDPGMDVLGFLHFSSNHRAQKTKTSKCTKKRISANSKMGTKSSQNSRLFAQFCVEKNIFTHFGFFELVGFLCVPPHFSVWTTGKRHDNKSLKMRILF